VCVCVCVHAHVCDGPVTSFVFAQTSPSLFQVRQQLSEMKSHVKDGDVAGSPAVPTEVPPAEQDPMKVRVVCWSSDCH
jgi:hypothetical protein